MKHTVHSLRRSGFTVEVIHMRYAHVSVFTSNGYVNSPAYGPADEIRNFDGTFDPLDGETLVTVITPEGITAVASTVQLGNYNKKVGVEKALDVALPALGEDRNIPESYPILKRWVGSDFCNPDTHGELYVYFSEAGKGMVVAADGLNKAQQGKIHDNWNEAEFETSPQNVYTVLRNILN